MICLVQIIALKCISIVVCQFFQIKGYQKQKQNVSNGQTGRWHALIFSGLWELVVYPLSHVRDRFFFSLITFLGKMGWAFLLLFLSYFSLPLKISSSDLLTTRLQFWGDSRLWANSKLSGLAIQCFGLFSILTFCCFLLLTTGTHFAGTMIPTILILNLVYWRWTKGFSISISDMLKEVIHAINLKSLSMYVSFRDFYG